MVEYRKARKEEADDLLDFINYVFSAAHNPHDFKKVIPSMYDTEYPFWEDHYVAVENGHIRATVALSREVDTDDNGRDGLVYGHIGQVSVHPYYRGENHMRILMHMAIEDMKKEEYDYSTLDGQRQRYGYYGYEPANYTLKFRVNTTNLRHVMAGRKPEVICRKEEEGFSFCRRRKEEGFSFWSGQDQVGILIGNRLTMEDEQLIPDAIAAYFAEIGETKVTIEVPLYEVGRTGVLSRICESTLIEAEGQIQIFRFRRFLERGLQKRAKAGLCSDGRLTIQVGEERFGLQVQGDRAWSFDTEEAEYVLEPLELQRIVLSLTDSAADKRFPLGWFPVSI